MHAGVVAMEDESNEAAEAGGGLSEVSEVEEPSEDELYDTDDESWRVRVASAGFCGAVADACGPHFGALKPFRLRRAGIHVRTV